MNDFLAIRHLCRANFHDYLHRALAYIPPVAGASVLDLGCGSGPSTLEMLRSTDYRITAIDPDQDALNILQAEIEKSGYANRISIIHGKAQDLQLPDECFYLVLAEGLFNVIGFEYGLGLASRYLCPGGYIIIHDEIDDNAMKLLMAESGFSLVAWFELDEKVWWDKYVSCLVKQIGGLDSSSSGDKGAVITCPEGRAEIEMYKNHPERWRSVYYIVKKQAGHHARVQPQSGIQRGLITDYPTPNG